MSRGRHKEFDRVEALDAAMKLFWEKGFEGTGLAEILQRTGIGRQSLYDTFGDKKALFLEALDHYGETVLGGIVQQLQAPGSPLRNVHGLLSFYGKHNTCGNGLGCLLVNSLAEFGADDPDIAARLKQLVGLLERGIRDALVRARNAGELSADADTRALARHIVTIAGGTCLLGRLGMSKAFIQDALRTAGSLLDGYAVVR